MLPRPHRLTEHELQWSHAPKGVETCPEVPVRMNLAPLQWSHAPKGVETRKSHTIVTQWAPLQWSHAPKGVETVGHVRGAEVSGLASMEPRPEGRGDRGPPPSRARKGGSRAPPWSRPPRSKAAIDRATLAGTLSDGERGFSVACEHLRERVSPPYRSYETYT